MFTISAQLIKDSRNPKICFKALMRGDTSAVTLEQIKKDIEQIIKSEKYKSNDENDKDKEEKEDEDEDINMEEETDISPLHLSIYAKPTYKSDSYSVLSKDRVDSLVYITDAKLLEDFVGNRESKGIYTCTKF